VTVDARHTRFERIDEPAAEIVALPGSARVEVVDKGGNVVVFIAH
jgi:hypothetical protein